MHDFLGPYRLLRLLGEGGMGQVYEARDTRDGSRVAVKLLRGGSMASAREKELFAREARVGMELSHPGLVRVLAVEIEFTDQPYLVMEYLPGPTLKVASEPHALHPLNVLDLAQKILETLQFLHERGVVHRDIKTGNLMLDGAGRPRLMDFGLTSFSDETSLSRTGIIFGSPHYMSPEQGLGETLDSRSDLFSFGVVLYELLAGRLPFRGSHPLSVVYAIINDEPTPLRRRCPELPEASEWVMRRALAKHREARYQEAAAMAADLQQLGRLLRGECVEADLRLVAEPAEVTTGEESFPLPLVGRERELARLGAWLRKGSASAQLFLSGEGGVGKTRLVREAISRAGLAAPAALVGRSQPGREGFPYQPWLEALRPALAERDLLDREALFGLTEKQRPGSRARAEILWHFLSGDEGIRVENREQLFEALRTLLSAMGERESLLIWLEDLHRADRASIDLLAFLLRCPPGELPLLLGTFRSEELPPDSRLAALLREAKADESAEELALERLSLEAVRDMVEAVLPEMPAAVAAAARLHRESRGNPFILRELLENLRRRDPRANPLPDDPEDWTLPLPEKLQDLVAHRLAVLDEGERELLELAAVEGEAFSAEVLATILEERKIKVLRRLQSLQRRTRLVQAREGRFLFDHALVRRALYEDLAPELRAEYHRSIAEHLVSRNGDEGEGAAPIALHFLGADLPRRALPFLIRAGRRARRLYALHEARRHLQRAREEADLWWLEEPEGDARDLRINALHELGHLEQVEGNYDQAELLFAGARSLLVPGLDEGLHAELSRSRGEALHYAGRSEEASQEYECALTHCPELDKRQCALILRSRAMLESRANRWDDAMASCRAAHLLSEALPQEALSIRFTMGLIHMERGELPEARQVFEEVVAQASSAEMEYLRTAALANLGTVLWRLGDGERAVRSLEESLEIRAQLGLVIEYAQILMNLAIIRIHTGQIDEARRLLEESRALKQRIGDAVGLASTENSLGSLELRAGRLSQAIGHYRQAAQLHFQGQNRARAAVALHNLGETLLEMGRIDEAQEPLERSLEIRAELGLQAAHASSLRARGRLCAASGERQAAEAAFAEALHLVAGASGKEERFKIEMDRLDFLVDSARGQEAGGLFAALREENEVWPPSGFVFEARRLEAKLQFALGEVEIAWELLTDLVDTYAADREPYLHAQVLKILVERSWPDKDAGILGAWREALDRLIAQHGFDWLR